MLEKYQLHKVILDSIEERGFLRTCQMMTALIRDLFFDLRYKTDTFSWVDLGDLAIESENIKWGTDYVPTKAAPFRRLMNLLDIPSGGVFVDFGSGKGKLLILATRHGFSRIVGIEFSRNLCDIAQQNILRLQNALSGVGKIEIFNVDAAEYVFRDDENVLYFFNPFDEHVMQIVLQNFSDSLKRQPRNIWLIYNNPVHQYVLEDQRLMKKIGEYRLGGNDFVVYSNHA